MCVNHIPPEIAKFSKGRTTFFSKEASSMLRPLLRKLSDDDLIFAKNNDSRYAEMNSGQMLRRALKKSGLDMKTTITGRYMINTHSFRAYGYTKLSRHDEHFAMKLAGHNDFKLRYDRFSLKDLLATYVKYEDELTIDQTRKDKARIEQLEQERDIQMKDMQKQINSLQELKKRNNS